MGGNRGGALRRQGQLERLVARPIQNKELKFGVLKERTMCNGTEQFTWTADSTSCHMVELSMSSTTRPL
jgi:hypothetical protein